ncbi:MAG: V-type ATP synthase subunit C [Tissierellia bacterium]|nr:V-type ATP synthase subunit C [Tissierellia bacterium]
MDRDLFIQASTNTRVKEKSLLDRTQYERLIEAQDLEEALRFLQDSVYQPFIQELDRPQDYEKALSAELKDTYKEMYQITPVREVVDMAALKYDYHNIKVVLKEHIKGADFARMYIDIGNVNIPALQAELDSGSRSQVSVHYRHIINDIYNEYLDLKDPQSIDILADKDYFLRMKRLADQLDVKMFTEYIEDLIDFTNIRTLLRCQVQEKDLEFLNRVIIDGGTIGKGKFGEYLFSSIEEDSPLFRSARIYYDVRKAINVYEQEGSLSEFEQQMDDTLMNIVKEAKKVNYGPEVIFGYLLARETEIKNIRIILVSKVNGLPADFIRERLRENYV